MTTQSSAEGHWRPSEYEAERFSLGRRAFNADEAGCCSCEGACDDHLQGDGLEICRALPLAEVRIDDR